MLNLATRLSLAVVCAATALATPTAGQFCFLPDRLDGECWSEVTPNFPEFPKCELPSSNICWDACKLAGDNVTSLTLTQPLQGPCAQFRSQLVVSAPGFGPILGGTLVLDYTRTWEEVSPGTIKQPPVDYQVWRFAVKIDMTNIASEDVPLGCPPGLIPDCIGDTKSAFYYGYLDYALNCFTGKWSCVLVLFHNCDDYIHGELTSARPGVFHPTSTFAIVAPDAPLNPFVPVISSAPAGTLVAEAVRNVPTTDVCLAEEDIVDGDMTIRGTACLCPLALAPPQVTVRVFNGSGNCPGPDGRPSDFTSINLMPGLPWVDLQTTSIGTWTAANVYPGPERAWVDEGVFNYNDSCVAVADPDQGGGFLEWFYGGTTAKGWITSSLDPDTPVTQNFTDLASNYSARSPGPAPAPYVGIVMPSNHLIYVNY